MYLAGTTKAAPAVMAGAVTWTVLVVAATVAIFEAVILPFRPGMMWGHDFALYRDAAARWIETGAFYNPYQLAGPYVVHTDEILYPPTLLPLLVPFTVLPGILWWALPLGFLAWRIVRWRPALWAWAAMVVLLAVPVNRHWFSLAIDFIINGNPGMWIAAFVAGGLAYGWPGPLVLLKPTMAVFALAGIRRRSWWFTGTVLTAVSLVALPLWFDYLTVLRNAWGGVDIWYTANNVPLMLIPLIAWLGRSAEDVPEAVAR